MGLIILTDADPPKPIPPLTAPPTPEELAKLHIRLAELQAADPPIPAHDQMAALTAHLEELRK